jgi:hypothetical protein
MNLVVCPHCKSHRIVASRVPKDVVVVMSCPACGELVVLFRQKVIAISRQIIENGTLEERKHHLANVIGEFLESAPPGFPFGESAGGMMMPDENPSPFEDEVDADGASPISDTEMNDFVEIHLNQIDDSGYFKKHFG